MHKAQENLDVNHKKNCIFPLRYYDWNKLSHPQSQEGGKLKQLGAAWSLYLLDTVAVKGGLGILMSCWYLNCGLLMNWGDHKRLPGIVHQETIFWRSLPNP